MSAGRLEVCNDFDFHIISILSAHEGSEMMLCCRRANGRRVIGRSSTCIRFLVSKCVARHKVADCVSVLRGKRLVARVIGVQHRHIFISQPNDVWS